MADVSLREIETEEERNFVIDAWLKGYGNSPFAKLLTHRTYFTEHRALILATLERAHVVLACDTSERDLLLGFIVWEGPATLHFCYVKELFRRTGIARTLVSAARLEVPPVVTFTHWTGTARYLPVQKALFNPYPFLKGRL